MSLRALAAEIASRLDAAPDWERDGDEPPLWNWPGGAPTAIKPNRNGMRMGSFVPSGEPLGDTAEVTNSQLYFTTHSRERMERGLARLSNLLAEAIGASVTSYQSAAAAMCSISRTEQVPRPNNPAKEMDAIKLNFLHQHYQQTLRSRIPALDDRTPRQALHAENGGQRVIAWL